MSARNAIHRTAAGLVAALACWAALWATAPNASAGSGRGTIYQVTALGGSPSTYSLTVNTTSGVTVGDHVTGPITGGGSGVWIVTAKTATTITVADSLTEERGSEFGSPVAGGASSVFAYSTPTADGLTLVPDNSLHWAAAVRRNTYLAVTSINPTDAHDLLSATHEDTTAASPTRGDLVTAQGASPAWARLALGASGRVLTSDGTDASWAAITTSMLPTVEVTGGGTGATTASGARTALGLAIGTDVQAYDADLAAIAALAAAKGGVIAHNGTTWVYLPVGTNGQVLTADSTQTAGVTWSSAGGGGTHDLLSVTHADTTPGAVVRGDLVTGQGSSATWARLARGSSGTYLRSDGTDVGYSGLDMGDATAGTLAVARGGTGATTESGARTSLGLAIGSNVQAWDADLDTIAGLAKTSGYLMLGNGSAWTLSAPDFLASIFRLSDTTDGTKKLAIDVSGVNPATTRTLAVPNASGTIALASDLSGYVPTTRTITATSPLTIGGGASADLSTDRTIALGTVTTASGGTGVTSYTAGDLVYYASGTALTKLGVGASGEIVLSNGTAPIYSTLSGALNAVGDTRGAVLYKAADGWAALAPGTSGQVLTSGGSGADPSWQDAGAGGGDLEATLTAGNDANGLSATGLGDVSATTVTAPTVRGGTGEAGNLAITSTSHATKGTITAGPVSIDEANGRVGVGASSPGAKLDVQGDTSIALERKTLTGSWTADVAELTRRRASTSGTPASGFGLGERTYLDGAGGDDVHAATEEFVWTDPTGANESADYVLRLIRTGSLDEALRVVALSSKLRAWGQEVAYVDPGMAGGRLTVDSADPVGEGTSATLYYLPHVSSRIALYSTTSSRWEAYTFTGPTLDVSALTADQVYDVFGYDNSGTVTLEAVAWSNHGAGTGARATALARQDGALVKSGDATRRYLGTIRTLSDSGTKARDASQYRFVWNAQNRVQYRDNSTDSTATWTPSGTNFAWAAINAGNAAWTHRWVSGLATPRAALGCHGAACSGANGYAATLALNWTSGAPGDESKRGNIPAGVDASTSTLWSSLTVAGYGFVQGVETTNGSGTAPAPYGDAGAGYWKGGMVVEGER